MNSRRWLAGVGLVGMAVGMSACPKPQNQAGPNGVEVATKQDLKALSDSLATLLRKAGPSQDDKVNLNIWLKELAIAVCQLEDKAPPAWGLDPNKRFCPSGGPPDKTSPPAFPPQ